MTTMKYSNTLGAIFILIFSTLLFCFIYLVREPFVEPLSDTNFETITGLVTTGSRVWYKEGPSSVGWTHILSPTSIENVGDPNRAKYISYPVGYLLPIYIASVVSNTEPSVEFIRTINLGIHFLIGLFMALAGYMLLFELGVALAWRVLFSIAAPLVIYFSPAAMYFYQSVYFADEVILLPFSLLLFLELMPKKYKGPYFDAAVAAVLFYGSFTDYLFILLSICLFLKRIYVEKGKAKKEILRTVLPSFLAILLFLLQLSLIGALGELKQRFLARTSLDQDSAFKLSEFVMTFFARINTYFGEYGTITLFLLVPLSFFLKKKISAAHYKKLLPLVLISFLPCLLQIILLNNHSYIHSFSMLKFMIPLSLLSVFLGAFLWRYKAASVLFMIGLFYLHYTNIKNFSVFIEERNYTHQKLGQFVRSNTDYTDVVFSSSYKAIGGNHYDSSLVAYAEKNIYPISSFTEIDNFLTSKNLPSATLTLVESLTNANESSRLLVKQLKEHAKNLNEIKTDSFIIYKFTQNDLKMLLQNKKSI